MHHAKFYGYCACLICSLVFSGTGYAASFDCDNANDKITNAICNNDELSSLDEEMSSLYFNLKKDPAIATDEFIVMQKAFLKKRNACVRDKDLSECLLDSYLNIIDVYHKIPKSVDVNEFEFNTHIKKIYFRLDITHPDWPYLTEVHMRTKGCDSGSWCESDGYLIVKDPVTELITQVIYLPHAFVSTDHTSVHKASVGYNPDSYNNSQTAIFNKEKDGNIYLTIPCKFPKYRAEEIYFFQYTGNKLQFLVNRSDCVKPGY
ncbi:lysozyme inhibitor LprI family protein [Pectobacterium sp. B1J-3]|uniref:lysozyme inhibitor LprI family protein n=1 Tax=Pectobacterium sp. B1J-3 TaxID=3385371 RepID=UPI003905CB86